MDFYVIPPRARIGMSKLGDRDFCLAQQYRKDPDYRDYFKQAVKDGRWVTLDNGAGDHDIIGMWEMLQIAVDLEPSEVIPPDFLFDGPATVFSLFQFIEHIKGYETLDTTEIFYCPQGATKEDWLFSYKIGLQHPEVDTIGMSKIAVPFAFLGAKNDLLIKEARHMAYDYLKAQDLIQKPIHLLGMGDPTEVLYYKNDPLIRSVDSCNTIWSAMNGIDFTLEHTRIKTPKDYFERDLTSDQIQLAKKNISWFRDKVNSLTK